MTFDWMREMAEEQNQKDFSQLCHDYYKLATMKVMQEMRRKFNIPAEEISTLTLAVFGRMLNEAVYAVGSNIKENYPINNFYTQAHLFNLIRVLNGEPLDPYDRKDIETNIDKGLAKFKEFIVSKAGDFYLRDNND